MPAPQGSKKYLGQRNGRAIMVESSKKVKPWRALVAAAAAEAATAADPTFVLGGTHFPAGTPLALSVHFYLPRPRSHYRTGRFADQMKDGAPTRPTTYPDTSKLVRSTEDALKTAGAFHDDAQIVTVLASKHYADDHPIGATIEMWETR